VEEEEAKRIAEMGKPVLGEHPKLEVIIEESYEFKSTVDKLIKKTNLALVVGTHSWRDQFMEAITVSAAGDEDEDESGEERLPSCFDYVMHFLTVFWKVLFACVPPTEYCHGWACFVVSILIIGMLTAIIGDLASHFGCTIGLKDSVTAVVFVAFGTSVPGESEECLSLQGGCCSSLEQTHRDPKRAKLNQSNKLEKASTLQSI
uniref:Sodium/calcium exchanger membrane region domain-containing protein n=1 Tax=Mus spicilegus TaxID=10103 RepID=A0A8C6MX25_MUSSI